MAFSSGSLRLTPYSGLVRATRMGQLA
ncbi:uncharacterized protein G2W53_008240 [Senna tora]|uniref:Uncharacterized protein n=1 Tax=Senna tora TaxID=362788 RepID=A0A834X9T1_9FABA|nr:uncharacterized protein G2W53_008240 [Senna tora]